MVDVLFSFMVFCVHQGYVEFNFYHCSFRIGFSLNFCVLPIHICNDFIYCGFGYVVGGFMLLDCEPSTCNYYVDHYFSMNLTTTSKDVNINTCV